MTSLVDNQIKAAEKEWLDLWKQGPSRLRWTKVPLQVGDLAPDFECKTHPENWFIYAIFGAKVQP